MIKLNFMEKLLEGVEVEWKNLGEVAELYGGLSGKNKKDFDDGNALYISYKNIFDNIEINFDKLESVKVSDSENQHEVKYGDILFTGSSETAEEAGMSSSVTKKFEDKVYLNSFSFGVRFNDDIHIIPQFSKYLFRSHFMRTEIAKQASGVTRFNISKVRFKKISIPIPPIKVQEEIVRILDTFTELTAELIAELRAELSARKNQYTYYRNKLLTFDEGEVEWKTLGELAENLDSKRKPITSGLRAPGDIPYYGASGIVDYVKDYIFEGDFLLVSEDGANLLARNTPIAFSTSGKIWVNNHAHVLKFKTYEERRFVEFYLNHIDLIPYISGAAQPKLNQKNLNSIMVPNPLPLQKKSIVSILDKFDALTSSITEGLPREIEFRQKQYEYYRNMLLSFPKSEVKA
jgi:type I restriction enzyme S subunit